MAKTQGKKKLIVIVAVLVGVLLIAGAVYAKGVSQKSEPTTVAPSQTETDDAPVDDSMAAEQQSSSQGVPTVDPETLSSIAIEPLGVMVYYTKGIGGFEYSINRTADATQYADFTATELASTKCTDDKGLFVSIIKNPSTESQTSIAQTVKVGSDTYGLSLAGEGCTDNTELLTQYQNGFKNGFSSLTAL